MALPNYTPSGKILFGSVPWDSGYSNVRLYTSLEEQYGDIAKRMTLSSDNYTYIGRNRRLKVAIEADRLYHCNYCMYRNESLTDGYIYCFVSDVKYINDHTSEITLDTDVFQTYLYGTDWQIPACFIERETTPSEDAKYMYSQEPSFTMPYVVDGHTQKTFGCGGYVVLSSMDSQKNADIIDTILNPQGYYGIPIEPRLTDGIPNGSAVFFYNLAPTSPGSQDIVPIKMQEFISHLNVAGCADAIVAIIAVPTFAVKPPLSGNTGQHAEQDVQASVKFPENKSSLDGYTPRNAKLRYYPYTFVQYGDGQGQLVELRYEFMNEASQLDIRYAINPACQAFVSPYNYRGRAYDYDNGMVVSCGALGGWNNNLYESWIAQNSGTIALMAAGTVIAGAVGGATIASASAELSALEGLKTAAHIDTKSLAKSIASESSAMSSGETMLKGAGAAGAGGISHLMNVSHLPTVTRGQTNGNTLFSTATQGVYANRICVKAEVAQQIDQFFDRWGYAVERIEAVNITSRPSWNYVKTGGAAPRSLNVGAGATAPFTRGRGTPADALDVIRRAFDGGITFWHNTDTFGDYAQSNALG